MLHVVSGALFDGKRVLMGKRKAAALRPGLWELPGGKVEGQEAAAYALQREWREELDLDINVGAYVATAEFDLEIPFTIDLYVVTRFNAQDRPKSIDHEELRWALIEDAVKSLPCSPAFYVHYPKLRDYVP